MSSFEPQKRRLSYQDHQRKSSKYRGNEIPEIENSIENLGESDSVLKDIERIVDTLDHEIIYHKNVISETIYRLALQRPEMIPSYVTLVGLLHVNESEFGSDFLFFLTDKINYHFQSQDYRAIKYLIRFTCDLANVNVISVKCVLDLFDKMLVTARDESTSLVYSNWLLHTIIISVPWMAGKADTSNEYGEQFDQFMQDLTDFYESYDKNLYKPYRIWSIASMSFIQKDYIVCAWENMHQLKSNDWKWIGITRPYDNVREFKKAVKLKLPNILLPSSSHMNSLPLPSVVAQIFTRDDIQNDAITGCEYLEIGTQVRVQVEEQIEAIILSCVFNRSQCATRLISLTKFTKYAVPYVIVEYLFQCVLSLSSTTIPSVYCSVVLCLLCKVAVDIYPIIINKIVNILINSCDSMNVVCLKKLVDFLSHYIANNMGNWNWDELEYINDLDANDARKIFLAETFRKLQNHYDFKFKMEEQYSSFNRLLECDPECNYFYGAKNKGPQVLLDLKNKFVSKIIAKASCDELYNLLDNSLASYTGETPFEMEGLSPKVVIQIHLTVQTLLAAHRYILSKTFNMIESHKLLLKKLVTSDEHEVILLYSIYQFWYKNPLRIKIIFFYFWQNNYVSASSIVKFLLHDKFISHLNKFYVWEIIDELLNFYTKNEIDFQQLSENFKDRSLNSRHSNRYPRIRINHSDDSPSNSSASDDELSNEGSTLDSHGISHSKNTESLKTLLFALFDRLCSVIYQLDQQKASTHGYDTNFVLKLCFNTSQHFQYILLMNYQWFRYIEEDMNTLFQEKNYHLVENLKTIYSRFVAIIS